MSTYEKPFQYHDNVKKGLLVSVGAHVALVIIFTVKAVFFTHEAIDFQSAVRVDLVGLPDKVLPSKINDNDEQLKPRELPPKPAEAKVESKSKEKPIENKAEAKPVLKIKKETDAVNLDQQKQKEKAALNKLKALAALDKIKDDVTSEVKKSTQAPSKLKGNVLSPGSALTGLSKLQHDNYVADLDAHIKKNWTLPEWLSKKDYKAQVRVKIDEKGLVISRQIIKSSGNPSYDAEILNTVDKSAPFPPPPEKFIAIVSDDGILIGFPE